MESAKVTRFKATDVPRQQGEVGRIRVIKGPDKGTTYVLKDSSLVIGRGEDVDVMITDIKASRAHARLDYTSGGWVMSDLGSANGIFFQGEYIRKFGVASHDHFTVGETILEFLTHTESTRVLMAPTRPAQAVVQQDRALIAQRMKVQSMAKGPEITQKAGAKKEDPKKIMLYLALLAGGYYFMFMDDNPPPKTQETKKESKVEKDQNRGLASYLPPGVGREAAKSAEQSYWEGFREYREGHYLRAKEHFELALQVNPAHDLARFYLKSADKEIDDEVKRMLMAAQKATVAGRLREAKGYYETAMRAMFNDRSNPDYIEAEEALKKLTNELTESNRVPASGEGKQ
ncbi:MAG: FHA domain-containing protein [Bdellovibrionales bacterium]|nr:FHA domain-containing protein [Bdellovibrionales bacterium]